MGARGYERLSRLDETFLAFETPTTYMHVALTAVFEVESLRTAEGGVDLDRIRRLIASRLPLIPRYRQRLARVPLVNDAIWVDDERFDLRYHVRHASLPRPGSSAQLRRRCAEILERPLNRARPLWEIWVIEGLSENHFALLAKVHHCMVDGVGGVELLATLLNVEPQSDPGEPEPWQPRPAPENARLLRDEALRRARRFAGLGRRLGTALAAPRESREELGARVSALWSLATSSLRPSSSLPFNGPVGPHRRIAWQSWDLEQVKRVGRQLGGTVNDIVLATITGALRRYLGRRPLDSPLRSLKIAVPVNVRAADERGRLGNRASVWILSLPLDTPDPLHRLRQLHQTTTWLKRSQQARAADLLARAAEFTSGNMLQVGVRLISSASPYNLIVTNVPGPSLPFHLLGARMLEAYPHLPLFENQGLSVALFSYVGRLHWGLTADWDLVPDLDAFADDLGAAFSELHQLAHPIQIPDDEPDQGQLESADPLSKRSQSRCSAAAALSASQI